jgi:hypothetical protein
MPERATRLVGLTTVAMAIFFSASVADAQKKYDPGASDTEIKIGNIMARQRLSFREAPPWAQARNP